MDFYIALCNKMNKLFLDCFFTLKDFSEVILPYFKVLCNGLCTLHHHFLSIFVAENVHLPGVLTSDCMHYILHFNFQLHVVDFS